MAFGTKVQFEPIREIAAASIGVAYTAVGTALVDHARIIRFVSTLDAEVYISIDGIHNDIRIAANSFVLYDLSANKVQNDGLFLAVGTTFYVKRVSGAPSTGSVWIEVVYASGGV